MNQIKRTISKINDNLFVETESLLQKALHFYQKNESLQKLSHEIENLSFDEIKESLTVSQFEKEVNHFLSIKEELNNEKDAYILLANNLKEQLNQFLNKKISEKFIQARQNELNNYQDLCDELDQQIEKEQFTVTNNLYVLEKILKIYQFVLKKLSVHILLLDFSKKEDVKTLDKILSDIKDHQVQWSYFHEVFVKIQQQVQFCEITENQNIEYVAENIIADMEHEAHHFSEHKKDEINTSSELETQSILPMDESNDDLIDKLNIHQESLVENVTMSSDFSSELLQSEGFTQVETISEEKPIIIMDLSTPDQTIEDLALEKNRVEEKEKTLGVMLLEEDLAKKKDEEFNIAEEGFTLEVDSTEEEILLKDGLDEQLKLDSMISQLNFSKNTEEESFDFLPDTPTPPYVHQPPKDMNVPVLNEALQSIPFIPTLNEITHESLLASDDLSIDILIPMHDFSEYELSYQAFSSKSFPDFIQDNPQLLSLFEQMTLSEIFEFLVNGKMKHDNSDEQHLSLLLNTLDIKYKE